MFSSDNPELNSLNYGAPGLDQKQSVELVSKVSEKRKKHSKGEHNVEANLPIVISSMQENIYNQKVAERSDFVSFGYFVCRAGIQISGRIRVSTAPHTWRYY